MAREFKVGQVVKIRQWNDMVQEFGFSKYEWIDTPGYTFIKSMRHLCGRIATITSIDRNIVELEFNNERGNISFVYTTFMIEPYIPTVEDLVGKVVELRNGNRYLCIVSQYYYEKVIIFTGTNSWFSSVKDHLNSNLLHCKESEYDIMKVYEPDYGTFGLCLSEANKLIWKRIEEESVKEMTIADVEKLVRSKVKIVKE